MLNSHSLFRRRDLILLLAFAVIVLTSGVSAAAETSKKLRLAYAGWEIGTAVAYVGVDSGLFKKQGLEIEELPIRDTLSAGVQSLIGVDLLIGFGNPLAVLQPVASGADITVIGSHVSFDQYGMGVGSAIGALRELKGKKVGVSALGARSDLIARVMPGERCASAASARVPPSPSLSARMMIRTYLTVTTRIRAQKIIDSEPITAT